MKARKGGEWRWIGWSLALCFLAVAAQVAGLTDGNMLWISLATLLFLLALAAAVTDNLAQRKRAATDSATGLLNKRETERAVERAISRHRGGCRALALMDIDELKRTNDLYGHSAGDAAILTVARAIERHFGTAEVVGRVGGDEFIIFGVFQDADTLRLSLEALRRRLAGQHVCGAPLNISVGIAVLVPGNASFAQLYREADAAMYRAKRTGERFVAFYDAAVDGPAAGAECRACEIGP